MPNLGSTLRYGNRNTIFSREFYKTNLKNKETGFSYKDCKNIIAQCNKNIADCVVNELDGFKLPFGIGYLVARKFKVKNPAIDWNRTKILGKAVYFNNLHTLGYSCRGCWYRVGRIANIHISNAYKFVSYRTLGKSISDAFGSGKMSYENWQSSDFIEKSRLEKLYTKRYRKKELKD